MANVSISRACVVLIAVAMSVLQGSVAAHPPRCAVAPLSGGYGNAGFGAGYGGWISGVAPCWRPCLPRSCLPRRCMPPPCWGWGSGWGGWYGASRYAFSDSVFLSVPANGSATFFSGSVNSFVLPSVWYPWGYSYGYGYGAGPVYGGVLFTPYGTWLPAGYAPAFGPAGVMPFLNAFGATTAAVPVAMAAPAPRLAMVDRARGVRVSNADARRRALKLVATGDRHMRAAIAEPAKVARALDAYRRAAVIAPDLPDTFVRQAVALIALDRQEAASQTLDRMAAIDARLARSAPERGMLVLHEIWNAPGVDLDPAGGAAPANWIAERWDERWHPERAALAALPKPRDPAVK